MKQLLTLLLFIFSLAVCAQQGVNYKALVKDGSGNVLVSQSVTVQFAILEGVAQTNVYQETHSATTDANGIVILVIGTGTTSDTFTDIDWSVHEHSLNVQIDSGAGLLDLGTTSFQSVPYAKFAENFSASLNDLSDSKVVSRSIYIGTGSGNSDNGNDNQNTAIGDDAMTNTINGAQNVAIGESTLLNNSSGEKNTVVGQSAMRNNTTGNRNTVIGEDALYSNNSGSGNVAIGNQAGRNATGSDKLYIDNSNTNNPLIWGDFTDGSEKVEINGELETTNKTTVPEIQITTGAVDGHVLTSDASGNASWQVASGGGGGADNDWTISGNDMSSTPTGNVGIGTAAPSEKLEVVGKVKSTELQITDSPLDGYVLTSDALGNASWEAIPGGGGGTDSDWTVSGTDMFAIPTGNVGIGTAAPTSKLEVIGDNLSSVTLLAQNVITNGKAVVVETTGLNGRAVDATSSGESGIGVQSTVTGILATAIKGDATGDLGVGVYGTSLHHAGTAVKGELLATGQGTGYGGYFTIETNKGTAVYGETKGASAAVRYAGQFMATGDSATGVFGQADGGYGAVVGHNINETIGDGVVGYTTSAAGAGVRGSASSSSLTSNYGGHFTASAQYGTGVLGQSGGENGKGVEGTATGIQGRAVTGVASSTAGTTNYGGYFEAHGTTGYGVYSKVTGNAGRAVYGESVAVGSSAGFGGYFICEGDSGVGVYGTANGQFGSGVKGVVAGDFGTAVFGEATNSGNVTNYGGRFIASGTFGNGVRGIADGSSGSGVSGVSSGNNGKGVSGTASGDNGVGVVGTALGGFGSNGVSGSSNEGTGVNGSSLNGEGVRGDGGAVGGRFTSATGKGLVAGTTADNEYAIDAQSYGANGTGIRGIADDDTGVSYGVVGMSNSPIGFDFYANGAGTDYGAASSIRWKNNIVEIDDPLGKLQQIRGVYYDWDEAHGGSRDVGMIAEEVGAILPEIVSYETNGVDAIGMDYGKLTPLLVEVAKEQQKLIEDQASKIKKLEAILSKKETALQKINDRVEVIEKVLKTLL